MTDSGWVELSLADFAGSGYLPGYMMTNCLVYEGIPIC